MTQRELIEFCKENDPNYNKDASFKENFEPMWSIPKGIGGIGITESEFKNGFYVEIDTKGRKGFEHLEERVFYFREKVDPSKFCFQIYSPTYKKFYVPLNALENWGKEIVKEMLTPAPTKKFKDLVWKNVRPQAEGGIAPRIHVFGTSDPLTTEHLKIKEMFENPIEEFPIQKIQGKTTYRKRNSFIIIGQLNSDKLELGLIDSNKETSGFEVAYSKQQFSDLVDLMIEARKDLLI